MFGTPLRANFFDFHAVYGKKSRQIIGFSQQNQGVGARLHSGKSWIRHCMMMLIKTAKLADPGFSQKPTDHLVSAIPENVVKARSLVEENNS